MSISVAEGSGYACAECGRVFAVENYCRKHMRLVHGIQFVLQESAGMGEMQEPVEFSNQQEEDSPQMYQIVTDEEGEELGAISQEFEEVEIQYVGEDGTVEMTEMAFIEDSAHITT